MMNRKFSSSLLCSLRFTCKKMLSLHCRQFSSERSKTNSSANYQNSNWLFAGQKNACLRSTQQYANFTSFSSSVNAPQKSYEGVGNQNPLAVEIFSIEDVKPVTPTPQHLRTYECSLIDIINAHLYITFVYFYPNNHQNHINHDDSILQGRQLLMKQSLSETLKRFYPFAGKVRDQRHINCNDEGVYYVEAKVNNRTLSEFLVQPDHEAVNQLLPFHPNSRELLSQTYITMIQVTTFSCGGISICLRTSHKICDGLSHATFLKAWAATARGYPEEICPSFTAPSIFLPNLPEPPESSLALQHFLSNQYKCVRKRIVFSGSSIMALKKKAGNSSRVMAVTGLIWKCAMDAASKVRLESPRHYNILLPINIRGRSSPPFSPCSIGNISWMAVAQFRAAEHDNELNSIVGLLKNATNKVNSNYIEKMKGEKGNLKIAEYYNEIGKSCHPDGNGEYMIVSSLCNNQIYEADFGWGKPVWACYGHVGEDVPIERNVSFLMDTKSGDGIEAWVSLREEDMSIFEQNPELLEFATVNPSPLDLSVS